MSRLPVEGETFGRYRLLRRLGHGGMGVVYAALDTVLNREVALKLVAPHLADDPDFRARFTREAEVQAQLDSPHAVRIYDHGEHHGVLYIATQLIEGQDLAGLLRESGPLSPALAVAVVEQAVGGLADAHAAGIVHRDVKPANVLVRQRAGEVEAFLGDFGIATTAGSQLTVTGAVAGSLPYMAPERHEGTDPGPTGDVYSAGCLLWFALVGAAPYAGTDVQVAMGHLQGPVPQLPGKDAFSKRANAVLAKAMAKDRRKRYAGAPALLEDLRALAAIAPGSISLPGATAVRALALPRRRRWVAPAAAVAAVLLVMGGAAAVQLLGTEGDRAAGEALSTEVTRTVRGPHGRNLEPRHTLVPVPSAARSAGNGQPVVVPREPGAPPLAVIEEPRGPARTTEPQPPASTAPAYRYRCWDGTRASQLSGCGDPVGVTGARWIFEQFDSRCRTDVTPDTRIKEHYRCAFGNGGDDWIHMMRFATPQDARSYLGERLSGTAADDWRNWYVGSQFCGYGAAGQQTYNGVTTQRYVAYYNRSGITWGFWIEAPTRESVNWGLANVVDPGARLLPEYQGVPL